MSFQAIQSENATLSSSKLPLAYYSEVLPPPLPPTTCDNSLWFWMLQHYLGQVEHSRKHGK